MSALPDNQATSPDGDELTDDEILSGLWWGDPEWPAWCDGIWREYVERMHEFNHYRSAVATLLRSATPKEATNG